MGGRSGQSGGGGGIASISGGGGMSADAKANLQTFANSILKKYGIKENVNIHFSDSGNKLAGHVVLSETPSKITKITINSNTKLSHKSLIAHELTHVKQINNKQLYLKDKNIVFKGKNVMTIKDYKKTFGGKWNAEKDAKYKKLAWEKEAYKNEAKYN